MKTWEMIKALTENPKLKFVSKKEPENHVSINENWVLVWKDGGEFRINIDSYDYSGTLEKYEWELIQEQVDFMTAVKAFAEGKTIRCEHSRIENRNYTPNGHRSFDDMKNHIGDCISCMEILEGEWFINE